jgi:Tol biopolymer transport system component/DNA-binding winged helix-turn-helix (wHTH) protein
MPETGLHLRLLRFGNFEVDLRSGELRKAGAKLKLGSQPFQVLSILLERAGEVVTREELQKELWPDTFVDVDHSLNTAINKIREVLGDSAESPRFVETLPRRGYRFIAPVEGNGVVAPATPPPTRHEPGFRNWTPRSAILMGSIALLAGASVLIYIYKRLHPSAPAAQRSLTRVTFDDGLQIGATWSPDSRFIAYSSNRGGKFDIWVQQVSGGDPVQITKGGGQNWQPDWSPDGKYIAYRSEAGEGGLFIIPALGGVGMERKVASFGYYPRWSPDNSQILFQTTQFAWLNRLYVVNLDGSPPREVLMQLASNRHVAAMSAAWHPDGKRISALINSGPMPTFWTGPVSGDAPIKSEIPVQLLQQIDEVAAGKRGGARIFEHEWVLDFKFSWAPSGRAIYFERTFRGARNIWRMDVDPQTLRAISIKRVTTGPGRDTEFSLSPDGKRLAFTNQSQHVRAWLFPFDATRGKVIGPGRPITSPGVEAWMPNLSPDGKELAFSSSRSGTWTLTESPLPDGPETPVVSDDSDLRDQGQWSPDSGRLAYVRESHLTGKMQIMEWSGLSRHEEPLTPPSDGEPKVSDWSRKSNSLLITQTNHDTGRSEVAVLPLVDAPRAATAARSLLSDAAYDLYQARFSPDERWIVFEAVRKSNNQDSASSIYVSPASGHSWIRITDGKRWDDKPHWSPDGKLIYFLSGRSGFFDVWAIRFDPVRGEALGDPFRVTALDSPDQMVPKFIPIVALSLTQDRLVLTVTQDSGSIWVLDNVDRD